MSLDEILEAFGRLVQARDDTPEDEEATGDDNFRCVGCEGCSSCRFCTACIDCDDCTYCDACSNCQSCTQSRECHDCVEVSHSGYSGACERCSYITLCYDCENCVHCFACVGLSGEEFCILNEHYARKEYFAEVARLRAELDARSLDGWRPPWAQRPDDDDSEASEDPEHSGSLSPESIPPPPVAAAREGPDRTWPDLDDASAWLDAGPADPDHKPTGVYTPVPMSRIQPPPDPATGQRDRTASLPWELDDDGVAGREDEGPTRPYPIIDAPAVAAPAVADPSPEPTPSSSTPPRRRGPSLRAARRPPRRRPPDPDSPS